jgi:hypothetical protein
VNRIFRGLSWKTTASSTDKITSGSDLLYYQQSAAQDTLSNYNINYKVKTVTLGNVSCTE